MWVMVASCAAAVKSAEGEGHCWLPRVGEAETLAYA